MDDEKLLSGENMPVDASELDELYSAELECPGVYHLAVKSKADHSLFPTEYYLVLGKAPISKEVKRYGTRLENGQGLVFSIGAGRQRRKDHRIRDFQV